jgi:hypothetical protein
VTVRRASFKQADAARALRAAMAAGLQPSGYTIATDGSISVSLEGCDANASSNSFDLLMGRPK